MPLRPFLSRCVWPLMCALLASCARPPAQEASRGAPRAEPPLVATESLALPPSELETRLQQLDAGWTEPFASAAPAPPAPSGPLPYAALGDSLTAGMQAAGLTAATQYAAYPAQVAGLAGWAFGVPATRQGCPLPMGGGLEPGSCQRVTAERVSNFAVPGVKVGDLTRTRGRDLGDELGRRMYGLILGPNQTQVEAALTAQPQRLTLWIGANDVLPAVLQGDPSLVTPPKEFAEAYRRILQDLQPLGAKTLLLTVPDVTQVPLMSPGPLLFRQGVAGADCQRSENRLPLSAFLAGRPLSCASGAALTPEESARIQAVVRAYNESIYRLAAAYGCDVLEVRLLTEALDMHPAEDASSPDPFGADISADGLHLSISGQRKLAHAVAGRMGQYWHEPFPGLTQREHGGGEHSEAAQAR